MMKKLILALTLIAGFALPAQAALIHRYSFNDAAGDATGATLVDSVGGADGVVQGAGANFTGTGLDLPGGGSGTAAYGDLPNNLISSHTAVTVEGWVTIDAGGNSWARIFDFGSTEPGGANGEVTGPGNTNGGGTAGLDYFFLSAARGGNYNDQRVEVRFEDSSPPVGTHNHDSNIPTVFGDQIHFAVSWEDTGVGTSLVNYWRDGNHITTDLAVPGNLGDLNDVNMWLGRSTWLNDGNLDATFDEFRIYDEAFTQADVDDSIAAGADAAIGGPEPIAGLGIHFPSNRDNARLQPAEVAGVVPQANWNSADGGANSGANANGTTATISLPNAAVLTDAAGAPTGVTVEWSSNGTWNTSNGTATPDAKLMNGYIDAIGGTGSSTVVLGNIPYASYDVVAYLGSDGNNRTAAVTDGTTTYYYNTFSNDPNGGGGFDPGTDYVEATSTDPGNRPQANYAVFRGLSGPSQTLDVIRGSSNSGFHAVQIIGVPALEIGLVNYWDMDSNLEDCAPTIAGNASSVADNGTFDGQNGTDGISFGTGLFGVGIDQNGAGGGAGGNENDGFVRIPRSADTLFGANATNPGSPNTVTTSMWVQTAGFDTGWQTILSHG